MKNFTIGFILILTTWGCQQILSPSSTSESGVDFRTNQSSYSLSKDDTISLSIGNNTGIQFYITEPSHNLTIAKKSEDEWKNLGSWYMTVAIVPDPMLLGSKNTFPKDISLDAFQDVLSLEEGQYRFEYILYTSEEADSDSERDVHTNSFRIES